MARSRAAGPTRAELGTAEGAPSLTDAAKAVRAAFDARWLAEPGRAEAAERLLSALSAAVSLAGLTLGGAEPRKVARDRYLAIAEAAERLSELLAEDERCDATGSPLQSMLEARSDADGRAIPPGRLRRLATQAKDRAETMGGRGGSDNAAAALGAPTGMEACAALAREVWRSAFDEEPPSDKDKRLHRICEALWVLSGGVPVADAVSGAKDEGRWAIHLRRARQAMKHATTPKHVRDCEVAQRDHAPKGLWLLNLIALCSADFLAFVKIIGKSGE